MFSAAKVNAVKLSELTWYYSATTILGFKMLKNSALNLNKYWRKRFIPYLRYILDETNNFYHKNKIVGFFFKKVANWSQMNPTS